MLSLRNIDNILYSTFVCCKSMGMEHVQGHLLFQIVTWTFVIVIEKEKWFWRWATTQTDEVQRTNKREGNARVVSKSWV
jgi:hypothetical protein